MVKWGEIKCPRCEEQDALWEGMERALEESDAREARLEAKLAKAMEECAYIAESHKPSAALLSDRYWRGVDEAAHSIAFEIYATLAELTGGKDE